MNQITETVETKQLAAWTGKFGNDYIDRNDFSDWKIDLGTKAFRKMVGSLSFDSVLEVGANIGLNLLFIHKLSKGNVKLFAVEPNEKAYKVLIEKKTVDIDGAYNCTEFNIPLPDNSIDLVFT